MARKAKHVIVHGRVQGVGFRYFVQRAGERLGLAGSVANRYDGTVEIAVEGDEEKIRQFLAAVRAGPQLSRVERLDERELELAGRRGFTIEGW